MMRHPSGGLISERNQDAMHTEKVYDVIIIGGGPAGSATALAFCQSKPDGCFLLLDNTDPTSFKIGESLPPEACHILDYLSPALSARLAKDTASGVHLHCTGNAAVWESSDLHETFALMNPFGMGLHLNRALFDESLRDAVRQACSDPLPFSSKMLKAKFLDVKRSGNCWILSAENLETNEQQIFRSKWVVDATGRKATLAHKLGAKTIKNDALLAFYLLFTSPISDDDHRTLIEATETGWWYTSQLPNKMRVVVYHSDDTDPSSKRVRKRDGFLDLLSSETTYLWRIIEENDYRPLTDPSFPRRTAACSSYLEPLVDENACWMAVGDAAMAFDPLSSQGMITAIRMGFSVGEVIGRILQSEEDSFRRDALDGLRARFLRVREDYETKKNYFYRQVRFDGDFWVSRRNTVD